MNLLTTPSEIEGTICNLIKSYNVISFASAWASATSKAFPLLLEHSEKINKVIVGIHFYQTNPNFIKEFIDNEKVKFKTNPNGVFHPKIYLFENNSQSWECLVGSANFTESAMQKNSEVMVHISNNDLNSSDIYEKITFEINNYFETATSFTKNDFEAYVNVWNKKSRKLRDIQDVFSSEGNNKPIFKSKIIMTDWNTYSSLVKNDKNHSYEIRLKLLEKAKSYFNKNSFEAMQENQRKQIAGIVKKDSKDKELDWMYFGHMASPRFKKRISDEYQNISKALENIPLEGGVTKNDYLRYVEYFHENDTYGYGVPTVSRFLAMKRPDLFFCLTGGNEELLYDDFGIKKIGRKEYERYWDDIIQRIHSSEWFNISKPTDSEALRLWENRCAMLDAICYTGVIE